MSGRSRVDFLTRCLTQASHDVGSNGELRISQDGKFEFGSFAGEFHIQREGSVAGVIKIGIRGLDHETAGAADVSTIGQGTGMNGIDAFRMAKI